MMHFRGIKKESSHKRFPNQRLRAGALDEEEQKAGKREHHIED